MNILNIYNKMENANINNQINKLIEYLGLTTNSFALKLGIKATSIYNITNGKNKPSFDLLDKIITTFNVNPIWLFQDKGEILTADTNKSENTNNPLQEKVAVHKSENDIIETNKEFINNYYLMFDNKGLPKDSFEYLQIKYYESMSMYRLNKLYNVEKDTYKSAYNTRKALTDVLHYLQPTDFLLEKFPDMSSFDENMKGVKEDWKESFEDSNNTKLITILKIMSLREATEHEQWLLDKLVTYMDTYKDLLTTGKTINEYRKKTDNDGEK